MQDDDKIICYIQVLQTLLDLFPHLERRLSICVALSQLYDAPTAQKNRELLSTLQKHITAEPKCFYALVEVIEFDEAQCSSSKETERQAPHVSVIENIKH